MKKRTYYCGRCFHFLIDPNILDREVGRWAHFDGTTAYPRLGGALPRVVVDIEIVTE